MLKRIRIHNFKTYVNTDFSPGPNNLVVGGNNSGKTNLCHAIRFLASTSAMPLQEAVSLVVSDPAALKHAFLDDDVIRFECDCVLPFDGQETTFTYELALRYSEYARASALLVEEERLWVSGSGLSRVALIRREADSVSLTHEGKLSEASAEASIETTAPRTETMLYRLYDLQAHNRRASLFKTYMQSWLYYCFNPVALRSAKAKSVDQQLECDGSNLSSMIYQLKLGNERAYRRLIAQLQTVEPDVDIINFTRPTPESVFMRFETRQQKQFDLSGISNGTLQFLALSYTLLELQPDTDAEDRSVPRLILIEEPENGIYVGHLRELMSLSTGCDVKSQFLFTSHSPYFIDLFEDRLGSVFVIRREGGHSSIRRPDPEKIRPLLKTMPLGELHFRGLLQ